MTELLSKLAPHAKLPNGEPPGGIPAITMEDVAGACARMNRHAYLYALAKFCLDQDVLPELRKCNRDMVVYKARLESWRCEPEKVLVLADLVLEESLNPRTCKRCQGAGLQQNQRQCPSCKGQAFIGLSGQYCAESMGVSRQAWRQTWEQRFNELISDMQAIEDQISRHIRRRVFGT